MLTIAAGPADEDHLYGHRRACWLELARVALTGWEPLDPIVALVVAGNIWLIQCGIGFQEKKRFENRRTVLSRAPA